MTFHLRSQNGHGPALHYHVWEVGVQTISILTSHMRSRTSDGLGLHFPMGNENCEAQFPVLNDNNPKCEALGPRERSSGAQGFAKEAESLAVEGLPSPSTDVRGVFNHVRACFRIISSAKGNAMCGPRGPMCCRSHATRRPSGRPRPVYLRLPSGRFGPFLFPRGQPACLRHSATKSSSSG